MLRKAWTTLNYTRVRECTDPNQRTWSLATNSTVRRCQLKPKKLSRGLLAKLVSTRLVRNQMHLRTSRKNPIFHWWSSMPSARFITTISRRKVNLFLRALSHPALSRTSTLSSTTRDKTPGLATSKLGLSREDNNPSSVAAQCNRPPRGVLTLRQQATSKLINQRAALATFSWAPTAPI